MQMSELMISLPNKFPCIYFTESKSGLYYHSARKMFALIYFDMGTCFFMFEQKEGKKKKIVRSSFAYSY